MASIPGLLAMPTVVLNALFGVVRDRSHAVRSADTLALISPMYNEEKGAARALRSLLRQETMPDQIALSINGGSDDTYGVVYRVLQAHGYRIADIGEHDVLAASVERWHDGAHEVLVVCYRRKTAKSESINNLLDHGLVRCDRVLLVDGDTVLHSGFVRALRDDFYRFRVRRRDGRREFIIEDFGLQSGGVTSFVPDGAGVAQRLISGGRKAEYAFATVLRRGQARTFGGSRLFSNSRLFTVVGCGFAARRDLFPMPADTRTEDHDFTLTCQNAPVVEEGIGREELSRRGFRFVIGSRELVPEELFDLHDRFVLRRSGNARFVPNALMETEDPPHLNGLLTQVERWNGGGLENALKRFGRPLSPNVSYTVWSSQFEDGIGLLLLGLLPLAVALNFGNPSLGLPLRALEVWLLVDLLLTLTFTTAGFYLQRQAAGTHRGRALVHAVGASLGTFVPYLGIKYLNPFTYIASATLVVPAFLRDRHKKATVTGVTWERPLVRGKNVRTQKVLFAFVVLFALMVAGMDQLAPRLNPINEEAWRLIHERPVIDMMAYLEPLERPTGAAVGPPGGVGPGAGSFGMLPIGEDRGARAPLAVSRYCAPETTRSAAVTPRRFQGRAADYRPLGRGELLTLARLAPIAANLETAATAYDVPADLLLKIFLNESYFDPLAVGPTNDLGISQMTSDALTLLAGFSRDPRSPLYNPRLMPEAFDVYDPDFSICAGAAKLAWAMRQPKVDSEREAYALYINPVTGFANGVIGDRVLELTEAMERLEPIRVQLAAVFAVYRENPRLLTEEERTLLDSVHGIHEGSLDLAAAYRRSYEVVTALDLDDEEMYRRVLDRFYSEASHPIL